MSKQDITRRSFLNRSKSLAASAPLLYLSAQSVLGANDKIQVGVIGCGHRAQSSLLRDFLRFAEDYNASVTAICDVWSQPREQVSQMIQERSGVTPKEYEDYRELLSMKELDAVIIACPDFHHCDVLEMAAKEKKDAYCEKPLGMHMEELNRAYDAVKENEILVQVGTQLRSYSSFTGCRKVVQDGKLGQIIKCSQVRNSYKPYWHRYAKPADESEVRWDLFLKKDKDRPFDADQFTAWYGYREFSPGAISGLMSHFVDLVHYITGAKFPRSAVTQGGIFTWQDERTCPDNVHTLLEYPEGFLVSYSTLFGNGFGNYTRFYGRRGVIDATNWNEPFMTGQGSEHPDRIESKQAVPEVSRPPHMENWLQCLRSREQPHAHIDAGYQHAVTCILADEAMVQERKMIFDPKKREIHPA